MAGIFYNTGNSKLGKDWLFLEFGVFFDGTGKNRRNTEIQKKVNQKDEFIGIPANSHEIKVYTEKALERTGFFSSEKKEKKGTSFTSDFSNVARMSFCTEQKSYTIYIEGIGTTDEDNNTTNAIIFGSGPTGVRDKVRKACEKLAEKIEQERRKYPDKTFTRLTLDIFGFSRGAAAGRNFIYEINSRKKRHEDIKVQKIAEETPDPEFMINNNGIYEMPEMGYLGYVLLSKGIMSKEDLSRLYLQIRFIGVYDTVASYSDSSSIIRNAGRNMIHGFDGGLESLQLNNLGIYEKAVHFTAMDEHRANFSLTRFPGAVEKNFPGVHSDIGGSYSNAVEEVTIAEEFIDFNVTELRQSLIDEYWFTSDELTISHIPMKKLSGKRMLSREYSYIPLHFMEDFFCAQLNNSSQKIIIDSVKEKYPVDNHPVLVEAKKVLCKYVFGTAAEWRFHNDKKLIRKLLNYKDESPYRRSEIIQRHGHQLERDIAAAFPKQALLRELRHQYLHWSSGTGLGMAPARDRVRTEF
jgi:hypothetical protein